MEILTNHPLADLSTYKIGGAAEYFCAVKNESDLGEAINWAHANAQSITILGGGSNILIHDSGIKGLVIKVDNNTVAVNGLTFVIGASCTVKDVSELAFDKGLTGIEWAIGIPGAMGGAIRGNAGAHGGSFDKVVTNVRVFDSEKLEFNILSNAECVFRYRHSAIKDDPSLIIWEITLELAPGDTKKMALDMEGYREFRRTSQPKEPSAGCVFKNFLAADIEKVNPELVRLAESEGKVRGGKIGAGYVIQKLGLMGLKIGGARISDKHANFVVNDGMAKAAEVAEIMRQTKDKVKAEYGIEMELEVQYLGFE